MHLKKAHYPNFCFVYDKPSYENALLVQPNRLRQQNCRQCKAIMLCL